MLKTYDGATIIYDNSGNPTNYMGDTMQWTNNQLTQQTHNGSTLISIQNNAGKRIFSLDFDALHAVHMHLPKLLSETHIPIGAIGSGIYAGVRQW